MNVNLIDIVKSAHATFPGDGCKFITQDEDGTVRYWTHLPQFDSITETWGAEINSDVLEGMSAYCTMAEDYKTAIITQDDFIVNPEETAERMFKLRDEVLNLESEIGERIERIRKLKAELAGYGFTMPFRRTKRDNNRQ